MKISRLLFAALVGATPALAQPADQIIYPSSDNRVLDVDGDGFGDASHAEDADKDTLNIGDNAKNQVWRSVIKFDLRKAQSQIQAAKRVTLHYTVRVRSIKAPREWTVEVVQIKTRAADVIEIDPSGIADDFSTKGEVIHSEPSGVLKNGALVSIDVTELVKKAQPSGIFAVRLQLDPATNRDDSDDQIAIFAGSHGINAETLRPRLVIDSK